MNETNPASAVGDDSSPALENAVFMSSPAVATVESTCKFNQNCKQNNRYTIF